MMEDLSDLRHHRPHNMTVWSAVVGIVAVVNIDFIVRMRLSRVVFEAVIDLDIDVTAPVVVVVVGAVESIMSNIIPSSGRYYSS